MDALKFILCFPIVLLCIIFPYLIIAIVVTLVLIAIWNEEKESKKGP